MKTNLQAMYRRRVRALSFRNGHGLFVCLGLVAMGAAQAATTLQFSASSYGVAEDAETAILVVQRLNDAASIVSIDYATTDGTARAGVHYIATNGTLTFAASETNRQIAVPILADAVAEGTKTFRVLLSNATGGATLGTRVSATVGITEPDPRVQFELNHYTIQESDGIVTVRVLRGGDLPLEAFTVDYATVDGTATNGVNYLASTGTLAFAQGDLVQTVSVPILYRDQLEPDRQFKLTLRNPIGGVSLGPNATASIAILDTTGMKPHRFEGIEALPDGTVRLTLGGGVSQRFRDYYDLYPIEVSSNLVDWIPLVTLQRTNALTNALIYADASTGDWAVRFYRTSRTNLITPFSAKPSGPYAVGVVSRKLTDHSRPNRYHQYDDGSFMVSVWYPAVPQPGVLPGPLFDPPIAQEPFFSDQLLQAGGFEAKSFTDRMPQLVGYALPGVPCAADEAPFSIVLCSPQGYGWRTSLAEKAANFASHGYVVAVSDPIDAIASVFPDGQCITLPASSYPGLSPAVLQDRWRDLTFILDELTRWNTEDPVFADRLDLANVAVMGTCCGVPPAAEFCRNDPRCRAAILVSCDMVDNWPCGLSGLTDVDQFGLGKPSLFVTGTADTSSYLWLYSKAAKDACAFRILGTQEDSPILSVQSMILVNDLYTLLFPNSLSLGRDASRAITDYSLWFLNKYLKGSSDPVPSATNYPRIYGLKLK